MGAIKSFFIVISKDVAFLRISYLTMDSNYSLNQHRIGVAAFFFVFGFCFASWASRIPAIQQKIGLTETELGLLLFSLPVGLFISLPISGWLVAKHGSRIVVVTAAIIYSSLLVTLGLAATKIQLSI
ncbi:MAG TPA: hypothetical protein VF623_03455, partial [Segetibacter sp.]